MENDINENSNVLDEYEVLKKRRNLYLILFIVGAAVEIICDIFTLSSMNGLIELPKAIYILIILFDPLFLAVFVVFIVLFANTNKKMKFLRDKENNNI